MHRREKDMIAENKFRIKLADLPEYANWYPSEEDLHIENIGQSFRVIHSDYCPLR